MVQYSDIEKQLSATGGGVV